MVIQVINSIINSFPGFCVVKHTVESLLTNFSDLNKFNISLRQVKYIAVLDLTIYTANSWFSLRKKKYSKWGHHCSFYSKAVWLAENLNEIKITHCEKIFSHIKQKCSYFEKELGIKHTFCLTEATIICTKIHYIKTKPKNNFQNI